MVDERDLNREIDKRVKIIDSKLKDAFSSIKRDIKDIKKQSGKTDTSGIEDKIENLKKELARKNAPVKPAKPVILKDYKGIAKMQIKMAALRNEQLMKEKIAAEQAYQQKLKHQLDLKKQESKLLKKQNKEYASLARDTSDSFTDTLKTLHKQQENLLRESKEQQTKLTTTYETRLAEMELQYALDKAKIQSQHLEELSTIQQQQDDLKSELYSFAKQLDKVQSQKSKAKGPSFWSRLFSSSTATKQKPVVKEAKTKVEVKSISPQAQKRRNTAILQLLVVIIPVILLGYIFYANFVAAHEFNYFYDIGGEQDSKTPYLTPVDRVTEIKTEGEIDYRNIISQLVYFTVPVPIGADEVVIQSKIKNSDSNSNILIGGQNKQEWSYYSKAAYSALLESLPAADYSDGNFTIWKVNPNMPSISNLADIPNDATIATDLDIKPQQKLAQYDLEPFTMNTALRGGHTFYVYLDGSLELYAEKQDLNWYNGSDEMNILLYDLNDNLLGNSTLVDDGFNLTERRSNGTVSSRLDVSGLNSGVYKLVFSDADVLITRIELNTNKIVTNRLFLADADTYTGRGDRQSTIYTSTAKSSAVAFNTYHGPYLQNISINSARVEMKSVNTNYVYNITDGDYIISAPKSNVIVTSSSYLTFSEDNYFEPFKYSVTSIPSTTSDLRGVDYIISGYSPTVRQDEWVVTTTKFNIQDLYIQNGKLSVLLNVPALAGEGNQTSQVGVDWINTTIHKNGLIITGI